MDGDFDCIIKFLLLGNSGVGKTSFLNQYTNEVFDSRFFPTIGIDFIVKKLVYKINGGYRRICLQIWDTAGQERYRSLATAYFRESMGFVVLFDITNEQSFLDIRCWLEQLRMNAYCDYPDIILCGNKLDLQGERVVDEKVAKVAAQRLGLPYLETSAASGANVETCIELLLALVVKRMESVAEQSVLSRRSSSQGIILSTSNDQHSKCFC